MMVGELAALRSVLDRKRAVFLLPLKLLVTDKHRPSTRASEPFSLRVMWATGEISDDIPDLMRGRYHICLLTYEKFASLAVGAPHLLEQVGTVVVDEVQMIANNHFALRPVWRLAERWYFVTCLAGRLLRLPIPGDLPRSVCRSGWLRGHSGHSIAFGTVSTEHRHGEMSHGEQFPAGRAMMVRVGGNVPVRRRQVGNPANVSQ
jgi:hypothetical protein